MRWRQEELTIGRLRSVPWVRGEGGGLTRGLIGGPSAIVTSVKAPPAQPWHQGARTLRHQSVKSTVGVRGADGVDAGLTMSDKKDDETTCQKIEAKFTDSLPNEVHTQPPTRHHSAVKPAFARCQWMPQ
jgi:hypothetical protein